MHGMTAWDFCGSPRRIFLVVAFRTVMLAAAVAVAGGAIFATTVILRGIDQSLTRGLNKFGADLLVVPQNALVNMKTALLTGEPSTF
jgi:putative ABC transport system permease protein